MWNLLIPPKVKHFIWRVGHNCLPTLVNLQRKHVEINAMCAVCRVGDETLEHALWTCPFALRCWEEAHLNVHLVDGQSVAHFLSAILDADSTSGVEFFCMLAWSLWNHRNAVVWRGKFNTPQLVCHSAHEFMQQWKKAQARPLVETNLREVRKARWQRPHQGSLSCNVDAAISAERKVCSFGCLLRDDQGRFIAGYGGASLGNIDPKIVEAMAFREALVWVKDKNLSNVTFQLDSMLVVQAVNHKVLDHSYFGDIIDDCYILFKD